MCVGCHFHRGQFQRAPVLCRVSEDLQNGVVQIVRGADFQRGGVDRKALRARLDAELDVAGGKGDRLRCAGRQAMRVGHQVRVGNQEGGAIAGAPVEQDVQPPDGARQFPHFGQGIDPVGGFGIEHAAEDLFELSRAAADLLVGDDHLTELIPRCEGHVLRGGRPRQQGRGGQGNQGPGGETA